MIYRYSTITFFLFCSFSCVSQTTSDKLFEVISLAIIEQNRNESIREKLRGVTALYDPVSGETSFEIRGEDSTSKRRLILSVSQEKATQILESNPLVVESFDDKYYILDSLDILNKKYVLNLQGSKFVKTELRRDSSQYSLCLTGISLNTTSAIITCSVPNLDSHLKIYVKICANKMKIEKLLVE